MVSPTRWLQSLSALAATTLIASSLTLLIAPAAHADTTPTTTTATSTAASSTTASSTSLPTVQVDGVVWSQVVVGNTVFVGGSFTTAQPAGASAGAAGTPRANMLAYDITTGQLVTSFAPQFNAQVRSIAASPDGTRLYVAGDFTSVNGVTKNRLVALDPTTGAVITSFKANVNGQVLAVKATADTVFFGGGFSGVDGVTRTRAAAVKASDGSILPFAPAVPDHSVRALVVSPDGSKVVLGGSFLSLNGSTNPGRGMGMVDAATGATNLPWAVGGLVYDAGDKSAIWSLSTDGTNIYGTAYVYGSLSDGNLEGTFNASWNGGTINWIEDCHGDSYGASAMNGTVYVVGHPHECLTLGGHPQTYPDWHFQRAVAFTTATTQTLGHNPVGGYYDFYGQPAPSMLDWYPDLMAGTFTGQGQAAWSVATSNGYVLLGGEFPTVNGVRQTGLARFALRSVAPDTDGPQLANGQFTPNVVSNSAGTATVSWRSNDDRADKTLTYEVYRNGNKTTPVYTTTGDSRIWFDRPAMSFTDQGLTPGATYTYRLRAIDPSGNAVWGNSASVTVATSNTPISAYDSAVINDGASNYWRMADAAGSTTAYDSAGPDNLQTQGGVTFGTSGPLPSSASGTAATFNGTSTGFASGQTIQRGPQTFSVEGWFRTTSTTGGVIVGYGDNKGTAKVPDSSSYDRHIWMDGNGSVSFGVYDGNTEVVSTPGGYNDGKWHYAVGTLGADGMQFFVDGKRIGAKSNVSAQDYYGYWRVGGDSTWSGAEWFNGDIADVAVYPTELSTTQVRSHWSLSGLAPAAVVPSDAYGAAVYNDYPDSYWRLDETGNATTAADSSGNGTTGTYVNGVTLGAKGAIPTGTAAVFDGSVGGLVSSQPVNNPQVYSLELWFNTTSTSGGRIIGFGDQSSGLSSNYDRQLWMLNSGQLEFGTWTGQTNTITSSASYNDGAWHMVVATQGPNGLSLSVDGKVVGTNPQTQAQAYSGYWRVGGDNTWGGNASPGLAATIDEVAIYSSVLSSSQIGQHYSLGSGAANQPPTASFTSSVSGLTASFDGSASSDPDGSVASYAWDFGDGSTGTGAAPKHTYAKGGSYTVTLTVTDNQGATGSSTQQLSVTAPNQPPTAAFTSTSTGLTASFDGSGSSDPDGTIASYAWDLGDGSTASTPTVAHTYATAGTYQVKLTVTDDQGATGTVTHSVVVAAPNQAPTASFTTTVDGLTVSADGSGSNDPDGSIASYAWTFGDGSTATGATASHTYTAAGTYTVQLTVTDNQGATGSTTQSVTVSAPTSSATTIAKDGFGRTVSSGFGTADTGGPWTVSGTSSVYGVNGSAGVMNTAAGRTLVATMGDVSATNNDVQVTFGVPTLQSSGSIYLGLRGRVVGSSAYTARITVSSASTVNLILQDGSTVLAATRVSGLTAAAGDRLHVRLVLTGSSPTTLSAKVWKDGTTEPTQWQLSASDNDPAMQKPGSIAVASYLSASATGGPIGVTVDDLLAASTDAGAGVNQPPTAAFTSSASGLTASFDGTGSSDPDGSVASWAWDFGDGTTGAGSTVQHQYAAAGSYTVKLTVTDNGGATASTTHTVSVAAPSAAIAADAFGRTVTDGLGTADTGGAWTITSGSASSFSVDGSTGQLLTGAGRTLGALLESVSAPSTDSTATFTIPALPSTGSAYMTLVGRQVGSAWYGARATVNSSGSVTVYLMNGSTTLQGARISGLTMAGGESLHLRVQVTGTSPTTVQARAWKDGTAEPTTWPVSTTDSTAALQTAGSVGLGTYLSASAAGPLGIAVDDYRVVAP
ncbi:MAG: PKD domain-containing protein [Curtobacterium sp.]